MLTIRTTYKADANGKGKVTAKAGGKQRTLVWDHSKGVQANHAAAAGAVANLLLSPEQQSKVRHPTGAQRVTVATFNDGKGIVTINV